MKRLVVLVVSAVVGVMVQVDCTMAGDAPSMKQVLLNPKGFDMDLTCGGRDVHSLVFFREDGEKIVVDIQVIDITDININNPIYYGAESCTTEAKLTDNGIIFNGCGPDSRNIPLAYDPGNNETPFKRSGVDCPKIALSKR